MDADVLVQQALQGTAHARDGQRNAGPPLEALTVRLPADLPKERKLLLEAGVRAIYRQAGAKPGTGLPSPLPAEPERLPACSANAAHLIEQMLTGDQEELLPEALELLQRAGQRLPHALLPAALNIGSAEVSVALLPALGERGYWLSRFNSAWGWVALAEAHPSAAPQLETLWQDGAPAVRLFAIRRVRSLDPAQAREWIAAAWPREKAEFRGSLVEALATQLSSDDEAFLEAALDDRSVTVRGVASALLAKLPDSTFVTRMIARADVLLFEEQPEPPGGPVAAPTPSGTGNRERVLRLDVSVPEACPPNWRRDGIIDEQPPGIGMRLRWLQQVLSFVPPTHWEERFGASAREIVAAAQDQLRPAVALPALLQAAMRHAARHWAAPLWDEWWQKPSKIAVPTYLERLTSTIYRDLLGLMPPGEAATRVVNLLETTAQGDDTNWHVALAALPRPWDDAVGQAYLRLLRQHLQSLSGTRQPGDADWEHSISLAAYNLPPSCFAEAARLWGVGETNTHQTVYWRRTIDQFVDTIELRRRLWEEIA